MAKKSSRPKGPKSVAGKLRTWIMRHRLYAFWLLPLGIVVLSYVLIFKDLPSPNKLGNYDIPISTKIYDRKGKLLFDIFADQNRTPVALSDIPKNVQQATIAIEDKDFYRHGGISPVGGMLRALYATVSGKQLQGGSTITQQLVKSALLTPERTVTRKIKEIILAFWVEILYPKDKILELYLNQVPYGGTAWGIETASEKYFGKSVKDLSLAEATLLAGLPQAPTLYSPFGAHPELSRERQHEVLRRMVEDGYITKETADSAFAEELVYKNEPNIKAPHFVMYVKEQLVGTFGQALVERGGLKVTTTLDLDLQDYVQATVTAEVAKLERLKVTNGASLVTKPATGEILAMVGSIDYFATPSGSFNVTTATRQPGSSIKPINYAIGLENRVVTPATMLLDIPSCFANINQPNYCPRNYDGQFHGPVQVRFALGNSYNIPAVKMLYLNTVGDMVASAAAFGLETITDPERYGLSLTLGGGEVRMTDMAEAFSVFANSGVRRDLVSVLKVLDKNGKVLFEHKDPNLDRDIPSQLLLEGTRVISNETAFLISHILLDNNARSAAFGSSSSLVIPGHAVSVKTGTTDDLRDNWTVGFTPQYLAVTWVGNNDNTAMNQSLVSGVTGAAPIWNKIMRRVLEGTSDIWPKQPDGIVGAQICAMTGLLPPNPEGDDKGCPTRFEYFIRGTIPSRTESLKQGVLIDKATGDLAAPDQVDNVEPQEKQVVSDGISTWCLDCPHPEGKVTIIK
ncbi:transglycosylase domain-containing protein [Candidatus Gottesmanbacteria bacterium]|nr:transglycosylase domain-containing protein [Candidatus Gottesmanbacteria bacterium]